MENATKQVQQALEELVKELETKHVRPAQKQLFLSSAKCCDTAGPGQADLQRCLQKCQEPVERLEQVMTAHLTHFQERMQRGMIRCQDLIADSLPASPTDGQKATAQKQVESCITECATQYAGQVPKLRADILAALKQL